MVPYSALAKTTKTNKSALGRRVTVTSTRLKVGHRAGTKINNFESRKGWTRRPRNFTVNPSVDTEETDEDTTPDDDCMDRLNKDMLEAELTCSICKELYYYPTFTLSCNHTFCEYCIEEWKHSNPPGTCPLCRRLIEGGGYPIWISFAVNELVECHDEEYQESRRSETNFRNEVLRIRNRGSARRTRWTLLHILTSIIQVVNEQLDHIRTDMNAAIEELQEYRILRLYTPDPPVPWHAVLSIAKYFLFAFMFIILCLFDLHVILQWFIALLYIVV